MRAPNSIIEPDTVSGRIRKAVTSIRLSFLINWSRGCRRWRSGRPISEPALSRPASNTRRKWKARVTLLFEVRS